MDSKDFRVRHTDTLAGSFNFETMHCGKHQVSRNPVGKNKPIYRDTKQLKFGLSRVTSCRDKA